MAEPLHRSRCVLHPGREAAGRCVSCRLFYCRECVTEHEGRLRCAQCLATATDDRTAGPSRRRRWAKAAVRLAGAFLASWLFFLTLSELLLAVPRLSAESPASEPAEASE